MGVCSWPFKLVSVILFIDKTVEYYFMYFLFFFRKDAETWEPMNDAKLDRFDEKIVDFFKAQGVPLSHISFLQDENASAATVISEFDAILSKTEAGDVFFFYWFSYRRIFLRF